MALLDKFKIEEFIGKLKSFLTEDLKRKLGITEEPKAMEFPVTPTGLEYIKRVKAPPAPTYITAPAGEVLKYRRTEEKMRKEQQDIFKKLHPERYKAFAPHLGMTIDPAGQQILIKRGIMTPEEVEIFALPQMVVPIGGMKFVGKDMTTNLARQILKTKKGATVAEIKKAFNVRVHEPGLRSRIIGLTKGTKWQPTVGKELDLLRGARTTLLNQLKGVVPAVPAVPKLITGKVVKPEVKPAIKVFRGGEAFDITKIGDRGLPVTTNRKIAEQFLEGKELFRKGLPFLKFEPVRLEEFYISPTAKIATRKDIPDELFKRYKATKPFLEPEKGEAMLGKWAKEKGFDAIDYRTLGITSAKEAEIKILNANVLLKVKPPEVIPRVAQSPSPVVIPQLATKPTVNPITKLSNLIKQAKPLRAEIEKAYTVERAARIAKVDKFIQDTVDKVGGEEGYAKILAKLKGELLPPKAKVGFEPVKNKLTEEEIKSLYIGTWKHPYLDNWEKISAADGLTNLLQGLDFFLC